MIQRISQSKYFYVCIFFLYCVGLWKTSVPLTGDQKTYFGIALEMRERNEWIIPYFFGHPNFLKPPFQYWATLLSWKVFGMSMFGTLVPSVLALVATSWIVNSIAEIVKGSKSLLPGFFFAASLGTMTYGTTAQMEIWIVLFYGWAWLEFLKNHVTRAFLIVGVMAWVKGPLYPALWVLSTLIWFQLEGRIKEAFTRRFLLNLLWGMAVGLSWYALAARSQYQEMMNVFFLRENLSKMNTTQGTPWGLWGVFLYSLMPWIFWLIYSLTQKEVRAKILEEKNFYLAFGFLPALFFTFFPYRVNTYLYLLTPVAAWMVSTEAGKRRSVWMGSVSLLMSAAMIFLSWRLMRGGWIDGSLFCGLSAVLGLWSLSLFAVDPKMVMMSSLLMVNLIRIGALEIGEKDLDGLRHYQEDRKTTAPLGYWIEQEDVWHEFGLLSAAIGEDIQRIRNQEDLERFLNAGGAVIFPDEPNQIRFTLQCQKWDRLKKRLKFPLKTLISQGLDWTDPEVKRTFLICHI